MKYFLIVGEASGDLHGARLIQALKAVDKEAVFVAWGGDQMIEAGAKVLKHYRELAFMGFWEVLKNLPTIWRNFQLARQQIQDFQPDIVLLIDYPGFNLRMAKWAKLQDYQVHYYISPQLWAWHSSRVKQLKAYVDHMMVILPFEKAFYEKYDYPVDFVGHPLLDIIADFKTPADFRTRYQLKHQPIIALLPGSRRQEIRISLTIMLEAVRVFEDYQIVVAGAPAIPVEFYQDIIKDHPAKTSVRLVNNETYALLSEAHAALVTSGTATLETALFKVPQVVGYKGNALSYQIAKRLIQVNYISLVNLIVEQEIVKELIQGEFTPNRIREELAPLLKGPHRQQMLKAYERLPGQLGERGAAQRAAHSILNYFNKTNKS
ncbi:MAG: lipid-A-disaccharide synthase [Bacteroidota bacterium]